MFLCKKPFILLTWIAVKSKPIEPVINSAFLEDACLEGEEKNDKRKKKRDKNGNEKSTGFSYAQSSLIKLYLIKHVLSALVSIQNF